MSDDGTTLANFGTMSTGAENFQATAATIRRELDDLESQLQSKLAEWEGDAQRAYWHLKSQWDAAANDMVTVVAKLGAAIETASQNYQAAERYGTSVFGG